MISVFNRKSVYLGYDIEKFNSVCTALNDGKIKYTYRVTDRDERGIGARNFGGRTGSTGSRATAKGYEVFVAKCDEEEAVYLISQINR